MKKIRIKWQYQKNEQIRHGEWHDNTPENRAEMERLVKELNETHEGRAKHWIETEPYQTEETQ